MDNFTKCMDREFQTITLRELFEKDDDNNYINFNYTNRNEEDRYTLKYRIPEHQRFPQWQKEKNEIKNGKPSFWSKPDAFNKYKDKTNILLITDKTNTDVYIISEYNEKINRPWWDCSHSNNGIIKLNIIGKLNNGVSDVASFCNYNRFSIGNKFQPIKKDKIICH